MKEILKYLRNLNSFSQEEIAQKLGRSRQSYNKWENGLVIPSDATIRKLAEIYNVTEEFIHQNKIPEIPNKTSKCIYPTQTYQEGLSIAEPTAVYTATKTYDAWFDGTGVRVSDENFEFHKGMKFKITVEEPADNKELVENNESDTEELQKKLDKKEKALARIKEILKDVKPYPKGPDEDPFYKEALAEARDERFGLID